MAIKVLIPNVLQKLTNGRNCVALEGVYNIYSLIDKLETDYTGFKERLCDSEGNIRRFINIFVNGEDIRFLKQDKTELEEGCEVSIIPAIAGG